MKMLKKDCSLSFQIENNDSYTDKIIKEIEDEYEKERKENEKRE